MKYPLKSKKSMHEYLHNKYDHEKFWGFGPNFEKLSKKGRKFFNNKKGVIYQGFLKLPPTFPTKTPTVKNPYPTLSVGVSGGWVWTVCGCEDFGTLFFTHCYEIWITWVYKVKMAITENLQKWRTQTFWKFRRMYDYGFVEKTLVRSNQSQIPFL